MVKNKLWLKEVLGEKLPSQSFKLDQFATFNFKLSDNSSLIDSLRQLSKSDPKIKQNLDHYLSANQDMSNTPIWLKLEDESILNLTLKDVYQFFVKYLKSSENEDHFFNCYEVSFLGPLGPYQHISLVECINEELLNKYLLEQLMKNKLPARSLRIRTNQLVGVTFGKEQKLRSEIYLKQITDSGLLFETKDEFFMNNMESGEFLKFYLDTSNLQKYLQQDFKQDSDLKEKFFYTRDELKHFSIEQSKVVKTLGYKSSIDNHFNLFCRYQHILEDQMTSPFVEFSGRLKDFFKKAA